MSKILFTDTCRKSEFDSIGNAISDNMYSDGQWRVIMSQHYICKYYIYVYRTEKWTE